MTRLFRLAISILILATVIHAIVLAYVLGFEHGVNSQLPIIEQLDRELHPGLLPTYAVWLHPLRNTLFGTGIILVICWMLVLLSVLQKRLSKPKQSQ